MFVLVSVKFGICLSMMGVCPVEEEEGRVNERGTPMGLAEWTEGDKYRMKLNLWH